MMADLNQITPSAAVADTPVVPLSALSAETEAFTHSLHKPSSPDRESSRERERERLGRERSRERQGDSALPQSSTPGPSRGGTLKKRRSLSRKGSMKRSRSRKLSPGTISGHRSHGPAEVAAAYDSEMNSAFYTPVATKGNPTEILANRFQGWRKVLKDLIVYFRDIQKSYDAKSRSLITLSGVVNSIHTPPGFLTKGGIGDATAILHTYHQQAISEANKVKVIEDEVISHLTGLRSDLQQKVKEIRALAGDFKNNVDKEVEATRRAVEELEAALGQAAAESGALTGKADPFIIKIGVERQLERQIEEENFLHRAFLNLENSGRELESIVVGEIQKAYRAYAAILKREADETYDAVEKLEAGPLAMAKEFEWDAFVNNNEHFIDPRIPVRRFENITYPGRDDPAASEVRSGMLERKSKYLKSYTPGWYVLSPSHLHEFKSPDRSRSQVPLMSLRLPDQKLGSHSNADSSSHKFMLKGRQSGGGIHRGHAWVFRAESYDTMLAWYDDIKNLTEKTGEERNAFIRAHARSISAGSNKTQSISDDGALDEDEADQVPYSATASQRDLSPIEQSRAERPSPGGRFPSTITTDRTSQVALPPSSPSSSEEHDVVARLEAHAEAMSSDGHGAIPNGASPSSKAHNEATQRSFLPPSRHDSNYGDWMAPAAGASGLAVGAGSVAAYKHHHQEQKEKEKEDELRSRTETGHLTGQAPVQVPAQVPPIEPTYIDEYSAAIAAREGPASGVVETSLVYPSTRSTQPLPANAAWASDNAGSVVEPNQIFGTDGAATPTQVKTNQAHPLATQELSPVVEQADPRLARDPAAPIKALAHRPLLKSHDSVATVSDLHVPGEFPRSFEA